MGTTRSASEVGSQLDAPVRNISQGSAQSAQRWAEGVLWAILIAAGAAIGVGIVLTLWKLIGMAHPEPSFGYYIYDDARQM